MYFAVVHQNPVHLRISERRRKGCGKLVRLKKIWIISHGNCISFISLSISLRLPPSPSVSLPSPPLPTPPLPLSLSHNTMLNITPYHQETGFACILLGAGHTHTQTAYGWCPTSWPYQYNNSIYLYSATSPELKFCSDVPVTTLPCLYNPMRTKYISIMLNHISNSITAVEKVKHIIYVNNRNVYINRIKNK